MPWVSGCIHENHVFLLEYVYVRTIIIMIVHACAIIMHTMKLVFIKLHTCSYTAFGIDHLYGTSQNKVPTTKSTMRVLRIRNGNFILICTVCPNSGFHTGFSVWGGGGGGIAGGGDKHL